MPVHPLQLSNLRHRILNRSHSSSISRLIANKAATVAAALALTLTFAACSDTPGSITAPEPPPSANPGLLIVEMRGLPAGLESSAIVSGPNGFQQRVTGTDTLQGLKPGSYTVTAAPVAAGEGGWQPSQESQSIQIDGGIGPQAIIISFDALIRRAQLSLDIEGLPAGVAANLQLSNPNGSMEQPAGSVTYDFAKLGNWTLDAFPVSVGAAEFTPVPGSQTRVLRARDAIKLPVRYSATRGGVAVAIVGLPSGQNGKVNLSGVNGFSRALSSTATVTGLEAGSYQLSAQEVTVGDKTYSPSPANSSFQLVPNPVATAVTVSYALKEEPRGSLSVSVGGLPAGQPASIIVTGPDGYSKPVAGTATLSGLKLGSYTVTASSVAAGGLNYSPSPATRTVSVSASGTPAAASVAYAAQTGSFKLTLSGLPGAAQGDLTLTGPGGYSETLSASATLNGLPVGSYTLTARDVQASGNSYAPTPDSKTLSITTGSTTSQTVTYALASGSLAVSVSGLPSGTGASVSVTGPGGYSKSLSSTTTLSGLEPGSYTIAASSVSAGSVSYAPSPATLSVSVTASATAATAAVSYSAQTGSFKLILSGLPVGANGDLTLTGPGGYSKHLTSATTLSGLAVGSYTLTARAVQASGNSYAPTPDSKTLSITTGSTTSQTVTYALASGSLAVSVSGLPSGTNGAINVSGPGGYSKSVSSTTTLNGLEPGSYTVTAASVSVAGVSYAPSPATRNVSVTASATAATAAVSYTAQTGSFKLSLSGLPAGANGDLTLTGPGGYSKHLASATTLSGLAVGSYTLTARAVQASGNSYAPTPDSKTLSITTGSTTSQTVTYTLASGSLAVSVSGLPSGTGASVSVTGPGGYSKSISSTTTLSGLEPGSYTVTAASVSAAGVSYAPSPATRSVSVTASATAATAAVSYTAQTGSFKLTLSGLPAGVNGDLTLTGPGGYTKALSVSTTLSGMAVGSYTLTANSVNTSSGAYTPSPASKSISITSGNTTNQSVSYTALPAVLKVSVSGLPGGATANITLTDPQGQTRSIIASTTLSPAAAGRWRLTAQEVSTGSNIYAPSPASYDKTVLAGDTLSFPVNYTLASGSIAVSVSGLPAGTSANISVSGPGGYSKTVTSTATLTGLTPGSYTVTAGSVSAGGNSFNASPASRSVNVTASTVAQAAPVTYTQVNNGDGGGGSGSGNTPNLSIDNVYLVQAAQNWEGTAPMVQGREALARVFVKAAAANTATPVVKLSIYSGSSLVSTINIPAAASSVPTAISEGTMSASWNVVIPAASVRANMQIKAELDPGNTLGESDRSDNLWPRGGGLNAVNITDPPPLSIRFVPVTVAGLTGNVTEANKEAWMEMMKLVYPLREVSASVRAPYVSNVGAFQSGDGNGSWSKVLSEVNTLRVADGVGSTTTHYFGVVKTSYSSGIAGIGYQPGRAAIGWDQAATYQRVFAHEIGHNFALGHAPCGVSGSTMYPYSGGKINVWGWNSKTNTLVAPSETDLMGYCSNQWISDWTISHVAARRAYTGGMIASAARTEGLLIWGRSAQSGAVLEPAFPVQAAPTGEPLNASHIAELYDAAGGLVASYRFEMETVDHSTGEGQFAMVVPISAALQSQVSSISIRAVGSPIPMAVQRSGASSLAAARGISEAQAVEASLPAASVRAGAGGRSVVEWNNSVFRMAMVRDRNTGEILSFLRQPGDQFQSGGRPVEIVFSDGTRNRTEQR